jgi:hypothetical protein
MPDTPDQPLDLGILPWAPGRNHNLGDAYMVDTPPKGRAV